MVWVDTETTGLDPEKDYLLEVCVAVTTINFEILGSLSCIVNNGIAVSVLKEMSVPAVVEMHQNSGLWEQIYNRGTSPVDAEQSLLTFLSKYVDLGMAPMCGSTIGFDRAFLKKQMPELEKYFHYRSIDVSTVKELARRWNKPAFEKRPDEAHKAHRAFADIKASIEELHYYRRTFFHTT